MSGQAQSLQWFEEYYEGTLNDLIDGELYSVNQLASRRLIGEEDFIQLERDSEGKAVCLIQPQRFGERVVRRISVAEKQQGKAFISPNYVKHIEWIGFEWFVEGELGKRKIKAKLRKCAEGFANEVNEDVLKVLLEAAIMRKAPRRGKLDHFVAEIGDEINGHGFTADTVIIPGGIKQRVAHLGIMRQPYDLRSHHIGLMAEGLRVYWSDVLDDDSILIFDGRAVTLLWKEREIRTLTSQERKAIGVEVSQQLNVLVENCQSVRKVVGIRPLIGQPGGYGPRSVFVGYDFQDKDLFEELQLLLENNGYDIVTGDPNQIGSISQAILDKIWNSQFFVGIMTKKDEKEDGKYTTSVWVLQEHAVAIAYDKLAIILVEDGVSDYGAIQGDRQRLHFSRDNWSEKIGELLTIFRSESRGD